ncbi:hypothetical protein C8J57DRAFT_1235777 [Mycena rebaudengoi]|nr:hypothetical protein C8J57DRAFT_1235777 [Mycena rebaudengoi]
MKKMKRMGRGHADSGVGGTVQGELVPICRACPHAEINMPPDFDKIDWSKEPEDLGYKYNRFVAQDCNFRLIDCNVSSAACNPILDDGMGFFVNNKRYTPDNTTDRLILEGGTPPNLPLVPLVPIKSNEKKIGEGGWSAMTAAHPRHLPPLPHLVLAGSQKNSDPNGAAMAATTSLIQHTVAYLEILARQMVENVREGRVHREGFEVFNTGLEMEVPEMAAQWMGWVKDWELRQHVDGMESLFELKNRDIHLKLAKEQVLSGAGVEIECEDTPSTFIMMGQEIEQAQRVPAIDVMHGPGEAYPRLSEALVLVHAKCMTWDGEGERVVEAIRLFMLSDLTEGPRRNGVCAAGLDKVEAALWEGEALDALRQALCRQTMTHRFKVRNATGQRALTRGQGILHQIAVRIHRAKLRHGGAWEKRLPVLHNKDVRGLNKRALTEEEAGDTARLTEFGVVIEGGVTQAAPVAVGHTKHWLSWIWYNTKLDVEGNTDEQELVEEEEIRRTIETGMWLADRWKMRATARTRAMDDELCEGLVAYADEQAKHEIEMVVMLEAKWEGIRRKGKAYRVRELNATEEVVVLLGTKGFLRGEDMEEGEAEWNEYEDEADDDLMGARDVFLFRLEWELVGTAAKSETGGRQEQCIGNGRTTGKKQVAESAAVRVQYIGNGQTTRKWVTESALMGNYAGAMGDKWAEHCMWVS